MKERIKKHLNFTQFIGAVSSMFVILGVSSFLVHQSINLYEFWLQNQLKVSHADTFFRYTEVSVGQDTYKIGERPNFFFTSEYYVSGIIKGVNTLKCSNFRSEPFEGEGFVLPSQLNVLNDSPFPFTFGGDLPYRPQKECYLDSIITLCHHKYPNVCKIQKTRSSSFEYIE